jgi:hypothetical protein
MASLNTPLSVRLSDEDTSFLAELEFEGAITASDKIRALIRQARQRAEPVVSFPAALAVSHEQLAAAVRRLRIIEQDLDRHSEVAVGLLTVAEEFFALALTAPQPDAVRASEDLARHEARLVDCAARMTEQLLRWAVTPTAPAYDPSVVSRRLAEMTDLMTLVSAALAAR